MSARSVWRIAGFGLLLAASAQPAEAQFGRLKKLKAAMSKPDSATRAKDSVAKAAAAGAAIKDSTNGAGSDTSKSKRSIFSRAAAAASSASDKLEQKTGISAKDAALAATGVGAAGIIAKKAGLPDPQGIVGNAVKNAANNSLQQRSETGTVGAQSGAMMGNILNGNSASNSAGVMMGNLMATGALNEAMAGAALSSAGMGTPADAAAMLAFQQSMMQTAIAASGGDVTARSRLDAWQTLSLKYQSDAERLSAAVATGDVKAAQRLQDMQMSMIKEWMGANNLRPRSAKP